VHFERALYGASATELLERLRTIDAGIELAMVVGHNPGLEDLALDLAGDGVEAALTQLRTKFPTGALATIDLGRSDWAGLGSGQGYLARLVLPRELPRARHRHRD
jgi:phosphohistidine phosphatase